MAINVYEDLFKSPKRNTNNIIMLDINILRPFKNHPFKVIENMDMEDLVNSIKTKGVITPIIVRESEEGYEIISGHRRTRACQIAGIKNIPAIVKNMTDDEAIIAMVDSNLAREVILPSEKAFSYKMKFEAMKHQGKKGVNTNNDIGKELGDSGRQVQRYIRLTNLIPELLEYVDTENIKVIPAVELSYISNDKQKIIYYVIDDTGIFPSIAQAKQLRETSLNDLTEKYVEHILTKDNKKSKSYSIKLNNIDRYFPKKNKKEIEEEINKILDEYFKGVE